MTGIAVRIIKSVTILELSITHKVLSAVFNVFSVAVVGISLRISAGLHRAKTVTPTTRVTTTVVSVLSWTLARHPQAIRLRMIIIWENRKAVIGIFSPSSF